MSEMQLLLYISFKINNMDIIYFEKFYSLPLTMAPAAEKTIYEFLRGTNTKPDDYDLILTGDSGFTGSQLLYELMENEHGIDLRNKHNDCGLLIFNLEEQDVNSGGSGCGCAGSVLCSHILKKMRKNKLKKVLFVDRKSVV